MVALRNAYGSPTRLGSAVQMLSIFIVAAAGIAFIPLSGFGLLGGMMICAGRCEGRTELISFVLLVSPLLLLMAIVAGVIALRNPRWIAFLIALTSLSLPMVPYLAA